MLGVFWFAILLSLGNLWWLITGTLLGLAFSVWFCGVAEGILRQADPGSVVLDEITAQPLCFLSWVGILLWKTGAWPGWEAFFSRRNWPLTLGVFVAFRFFDIVKPWPVRQSQRLPGGWGVTIDDVLAAVYVNLVVLAVYAGGKLLGLR
jgi:phosphatidylglycerophosphatase A